MGSNSYYHHSFCAAFLARHDSNSRQWHIQTLGQLAQLAPESLVRAIFQCRRRKPNLQRATMLAFNCIAAAAGHNPDRKCDAVIAPGEVDHGLSIPRLLVLFVHASALAGRNCGEAEDAFLSRLKIGS
jgi:hypothetical protein